MQVASALVTLADLYNHVCLSSLHAGYFFMLLWSSAGFFQNYFFKNYPRDQYQSDKRFESISGLMFCWSWSGSKLFAKVISR